MEELWKDYKKRKKGKRQANKEIEERDPQRTISYRPSKDGLFVLRDWQRKKKYFSTFYLWRKRKRFPRKLSRRKKLKNNQPNRIPMYVCTKKELKYEINSTKKEKENPSPRW